MKNYVLAISFLALLTLSLSAQQSKPSPSTPKTVRPNLKESPKDQTPQNSNNSATLPVGTPVRMKLETPLYSASTKAGDNFAGRILEDVKLEDKVVIPVGASLQGHVMQVSDPRRIKGKATIVLRPESLTLPNGQRFTVNASVVDTNKVNGTDVDDEGRIKGPGHGSHDALEVGAGTGAGAVIGGLAGGGKGLLIGAVIGAGGTAAHWLSKKNSAYLPAGSEIIFELSRPMTVTAHEPASRTEGSM
ncbi:MAG TPA: hypothetical protein VG759_07790 [Candidatus Angelobacter sp.]|jgi:hypothetical protein|nr:hypothetical protein [Candidatus Angelobacter sp.]